MSRNRYACLICLVWTAPAAALGEFATNRIYWRESAVFAGGWVALSGSLLILSCFTALLLVLTNRQLLAVFCGLSLYGFLVAVDSVKLLYLDNPLRPTDFQYLADLRVVAGPFLNTGAFWGLLAAALRPRRF